ncbi:bifunctional glutamate N-acetyltransferase/amino-acid acetyltransferase ArgJ [Salinisphaera orenii]|uniref:bifunctional glutamate N-acetyltransferase/amino-acid acetyltransferase ArgJ n=1 Tax=Salinisphaera orenii TaxID=856731 RepID=UPI000DBE0568
MAVNLSEPDTLRPVDGARWAVVDAAIKAPGDPDLALLTLDAGTRVSAVLTRNAFAAAPIVAARMAIGAGDVRALLVNSGNANAGVGTPGEHDAADCCARVAKVVGVGSHQVAPFSTGVIGQRLPMGQLLPAIDRLVEPDATADWVDAARAIMTTDTVPKGASRQLTTANGETVTLTGIAKGSGMIRPDMATMLGFVATDAAVPQEDLDAALRAANDRSFSCISVDGDTSTNDAFCAAATGRGAGLSSEAPDWRAFVDALVDLSQALAQAIVRDAEGATRFITLSVTGAHDRDEARAVAFTIAHSPLFKTAAFAGDPNWGRLLAAVGRAPIDELAIEGVSIGLDDIRVVTGGGLDSDYREADGAAVMAQSEYTVAVDLGRGQAEATVWTSDLSEAYVRINADYRS